MKWVLNKWGGRKRRWCGTLKEENEGVKRGESVETIVHGLKPCLSRFLSMVFKENNWFN